MEFRCNRLGYLFIRRNFRQALGIYGAAFLLPSLVWILVFGRNTLKVWIVIPIFFCLATILTLFSVIYMPKWLSFDHKQLIWTEKLNVRHDEIKHYVIVFRWDHFCMATVTVGNLHSIEFLQSPIERLFNIGRIQFRGDIRSLEASKPVVNPAIPFCYGGIRRFDEFKACLTDQLPSSAFQSK